MKPQSSPHPSSVNHPKSWVSIYLFTGSHLPLWMIKLSLRNRLGEAMNQLIVNGIAKKEAYAILKKGLDLLHKEDFWKELKGGLAIFLHKNYFSAQILPYRVDPEVYVESEFVMDGLASSPQ